MNVIVKALSTGPSSSRKASAVGFVMDGHSEKEFFLIHKIKNELVF